MKDKCELHCFRGQLKIAELGVYLDIWEESSPSQKTMPKAFARVPSASGAHVR